MCVFFSINGLLQSVGWPSSFVIFNNWFGKKGRGTIVGLWSSSSNGGNVVGSFLTSIFLQSAGLSWYYAYMLCGITPFLLSILNLFLLVNHPKDKGLHVQEIDPELVEAEKLLVEEGLLDTLPVEADLIEEEQHQIMQE